MIHGYDTPYDFDMALTEPVFYMMQRGIRIDKDVRNEFHRETHAQWEVFQAQLNSVAGHTLNANSPVTITAEIDLTGEGRWATYAEFEVKTGTELTHTFPEEFQAYWIRFKTSAACAATAQLEYR